MQHESELVPCCVYIFAVLSIREYTGRKLSGLPVDAAVTRTMLPTRPGPLIKLWFGQFAAYFSKKNNEPQFLYGQLNEIKTGR